MALRNLLMSIILERLAERVHKVDYLSSRKAGSYPTGAEIR